MGNREVPREDSFEDWPGETCYRCGKRIINGYKVDDAVWEKVVGQSDISWCPVCFDVEAQGKGVEYHFEQYCAISWSDWKKIEEREKNG